MKVHISNPRFKEEILNHKLIHLIFEDRKIKFRKGQKLRFWLDNLMDDKKSEEFHLSTCAGVQKIEFEFLTLEKSTVTDLKTKTVEKSKFDKVVIKVDNRRLESEEIEELAFNSGYKDAHHMTGVFKDLKPNGFKGYLVHWTKKKY